MVLVLLACAEKPVEGVTYYADVRPILDQSCARCHTDTGQALSFDDPAAVQALADSIVTRTEAGDMPPPAPDPDCAPYVGSDELFLDDARKATLRAWAEAGAPLGDPATYPGEPPSHTTAPFDAELRGSGPYTPTFDSTGNDYRCFQLDVGNTEAAYVTGFEALVDNPRIVHHVVLWNVRQGVEIPAEDGVTPGFACDGFGEDGWDFFGGWAPGGRPVTFAEGQGIRVRAASRMVLQMHYFDAFEGADAEADQSGYGLHLADEVSTEVSTYPLGVEDFEIPAGEYHEEEMIIPWQDGWGDITIVGVFPHMHVLGSSFGFDVHHADGSESCLVDIPRWDFHNQQAVILDEPVHVTGGDVLDLNCHWDNTASNPAQVNDPPQDVTFGEGTSDEMCYGFTYGYQG